MDTIKKFLQDSLRYETIDAVSDAFMESTKQWLASFITDNIVKIRNTDKKGLSIYVKKSEFPSAEIESVITAIKGLYVEGTKKRPTYVSNTVEPMVNVLNICINKHFRAWAIANIDVPVNDNELSKDDTILRNFTEEHPDIAKPIICKEIGCKLVKEARRLSQLIEGTILENDYDLSELVLPKMNDIASLLLHADSFEPSFDLKKEKRELKRLKSMYLTEKK